jgi:hypothetical protein
MEYIVSRDDPKNTSRVGFFLRRLFRKIGLALSYRYYICLNYYMDSCHYVICVHIVFR